MATELLDGTISPAQPVRTKGKYVMFDRLSFRDRDGGERSLKNVCCAGDVADAVRKGGTGRFYLSSGGGQTGIHGVRLDDGTKAYAHYNNMEVVVLIGIAAGAAILIYGLITGEIMMLPVIIGVLLVGAYVFMRSIRVAGRKQYDADNAA